MNTLYLAVSSYSKSLIKELAILIQILILAYCFSYSMCYVFEADASVRYAEKTFKEDAAYFAFKERFQSEADYQMAVYGRLERSPLFADAFEALNGLDDLDGIGRAFDVEFKFGGNISVGSGEDECEDNDIRINGVMYNSDLLKYAPLGVSRGRWFEDEETKALDVRKGAIPVVLGGAYKGNYKVGSEVNAMLMVYSNADVQHTISQDGMNSEIRIMQNKEEVPVKLMVIGHMHPDAMPYNFSYGGTFQTMNNVFRPQSAEALEVISPVMLVNGENLNDCIASGFNMLLFSKSLEKVKKVWEQSAGIYGSIDSVDELAKNEDRLFKGGGRVYYLYTAFSILLILFGVCGYNVLSLKQRQKSIGVYFMCGMTRSRGAVIALLGNAVFFTIGAVCGVLLGLAHAQSLRSFMRDSVIMSAAAATALITVLYIAVSLITVYGMMRLETAQILKKGDE